MTGVIVPAGSGSIAVLERGGGNSGNLEQLAQQMQQDVHWLPEDTAAAGAARRERGADRPKSASERSELQR